jgi:hypothetical protein
MKDKERREREREGQERDGRGEGEDRKRLDFSFRTEEAFIDQFQLSRCHLKTLASSNYAN